MASAYLDRPQPLSLFDGFPYLSTRVVGALHHLILLPADGVEAELVGLARHQAQANQLPSCLVLASDRAIYCDPEGGMCASHQPPRGGHTIAGGLTPAIDVDDSSTEFHTRQNRLTEMIDRARRRGGHILGDLTKGGRAATDDEQHTLAGVLPDGTPRGLNQCEHCGDWTGVCLDPSEQFAGQVMTVHCYCDNHNRCARCSERLHERRLNANYYECHDRTIWHVPGFCGLSHRCSVREPSGGRAQ
jgi:hypothetical protein